MNQQFITIEPHEDPDPRNKRTFTVNFFTSAIYTILTYSPAIISDWITRALRSRHYRRHKLVVGLGVQWRPAFSRSVPSAATLQLCIGSRCLIIQLLYADSVPQILRDFLNNPNITFVGVWNSNDEAMLSSSRHQLSISRLLDLRYVAAEQRGLSTRQSLQSLASIILGTHDVNKAAWIGKSNWDAFWLTNLQIQYACVDAAISFLLGKELEAWNWVNGFW